MTMHNDMHLATQFDLFLCCLKNFCLFLPKNSKIEGICQIRALALNICNGCLDIIVFLRMKISYYYFTLYFRIQQYTPTILNTYWPSTHTPHTQSVYVYDQYKADTGVRRCLVKPPLIHEVINSNHNSYTR